MTCVISIGVHQKNPLGFFFIKVHLNLTDSSLMSHTDPFNECGAHRYDGRCSSLRSYFPSLGSCHTFRFFPRACWRYRTRRCHSSSVSQLHFNFLNLKQVSLTSRLSFATTKAHTTFKMNTSSPSLAVQRTRFAILSAVGDPCPLRLASASPRLREWQLSRENLRDGPVRPPPPPLPVFHFYLGGDSGVWGGGRANHGGAAVRGAYHNDGGFGGANHGGAAVTRRIPDRQSSPSFVHC